MNILRLSGQIKNAVSEGPEGVTEN